MTTMRGIRRPGRFLIGTLAVAMPLFTLGNVAIASPSVPPEPPSTVDASTMIAPVFDLKDAAMPVFDFIFVTGSVDGAATSAETDAGQVTTLSGDVNFAVDSDQLTDRAREVLNDLAAQWNAKKPTKVTVVGHTDSVADDSHNLDLSKRRAKAVGDYLNSKVSGLSLTTDGKGESEPIADESEGSDEEKEKAKAANRRVEITAEVPE